MKDLAAQLLDKHLPPYWKAELKQKQPVRDHMVDAIAGSLAHHCGQFQAHGQVLTPREVSLRLAEGGFAARPFAGCNLWLDIILAAGLAGGLDAAAQLFRTMYDEDVHSWSRRYGRGDATLAEDFLPDLLIPRKRSGPRIETYKGHAPLRAWLKQVLRSVADRRRESSEVVVDVDQVDPQSIRGSATGSTGDLDPGEAYAAQDCREKIQPLLQQAFGALTDQEHNVVMMSVIDNVPQTKIAQVFGVPNYKITRIKQSSFKKLRETMYSLAKSASELGVKAARDCISLLLARFGS